jgi:hypothetical protein
VNPPAAPAGHGLANCGALQHQACYKRAQCAPSRRLEVLAQHHAAEHLTRLLSVSTDRTSVPSVLSNYISRCACGHEVVCLFTERGNKPVETCSLLKSIALGQLRLRNFVPRAPRIEQSSVPCSTIADHGHHLGLGFLITMRRATCQRVEHLELLEEWDF